MSEETVKKTSDSISIGTSVAQAISQPKKRKKTSFVWRAFEEIEKGGVLHAKCKHCCRIMGAESKNGTSNMRKHLLNCDIYKKVQKQIDKNQMYLRVDEDEDGSFGVQKFRYDPEVTREAIAQMIIVHEYPFSMVQHIGFRRVLSSMQPSFKAVTRNTIRADCMKIYENEKLKLYGILDKLQCRISLTSDFWSSGQNIGYMSLTVHYIDESWKIQKRILCFCTIDDRHTGENVANALLEKLYKWNLDRKLGCINLDNCSTNDVVVRELLRKLEPKGVLVFDGKLFQVRCSTHILNLIVQDGLKEIEKEIERIRESIKFIRNSPQRQRKFENVCKQVRAPQKTLVQDVSTRWNSTYMMLETALEFKDAFFRFAEVERNFKCVPSEMDWKNARIISECLKVFYDATQILSGSKYTTVNRYFDLACGIRLQLDEWCTCGDAFIMSMAMKMKEKFNKYWSITCLVFAIASILDPRIKMKSIDFYFPQIYGSQFEEKIVELRSTLTSLYNEYAASSSASSQLFPWNTSDTNKASGSGPSGGANGGASGISSRGTLSSKLKLFENYLEESSQDGDVKTDLETYLGEAVHPVQKGKGLDDETFDVLSWWHYNAPKYPIMGKMARDILAIPASTVASESAFSTGGRVIDRYRSTMRPKTVEALICAQDWIRKEMEGEGILSDNLSLETVTNAIDEINANESFAFDDEDIYMTNASISSIHDLNESEPELD